MNHRPRYAAVAISLAIVIASGSERSLISQEEERDSEAVCRVLRGLCMRDDLRFDRVGCQAYSLHCDVRVGAIGDSVTDEYQGFSNLAGLGWVEQLADRLDFGASESKLSVRGEPRQTGFATNWARFGQAALDLQWALLLPLGLSPRLDTILPISAQVEGLRRQIEGSEIDVAIVYVGHNDAFIHWVTGGSFEEPGFDAFSQALVDRIAEIVDTLREAGDVRLIVSLNSLAGPVVIGAQSPSLQLAAQMVGPAMARHNEALAAAMSERGIPVTDLIGNIFVDSERYDSEARVIHVGEHVIGVDSIASVVDLLPAGAPLATGPCLSFGGSPWCSTPQYNLRFLVHDATHPTTIVQGLMANEFLEAIRQAFGFDLLPLSDDEILRNAGVANDETE